MLTNGSYHEKQKRLLNEKYETLLKTLPAYAQAYLNSIYVAVERQTLVAYTYDLITFFKFLIDRNVFCKNLQIKDISLEIIDQLALEDIQEYQRYLLNTKIGEDKEYHSNEANGVNRRISALRGMLKYLVAERKIQHDASSGLRKVKQHKQPIIRMNVAEANSLMNAAATTNLASSRQRAFCKKTQLRDLAIITLLLNTGIRVSECVGLDVEDLNFRNNSIYITRKGGSSEIVYFNDFTNEVLQSYINNERFALLEGTESDTTALFLSNRKQRMCVKAVENVVKKYAQESVPDKKITCHKLRSTYGTNLYNSTGDIKLVADTLGHKSVDTTHRHYAASEEHHKKLAGYQNLYTTTDDKK